MKLQPIAIEGLKELDAALAELGREASTRLGHKAIKASAEQLQSAWQAGAPYAPGTRMKYWTVVSGETQSALYGHLRDNIRIRKVKPDKETAIVYGVTTGNAFWGRMLEFGTGKMPPRPWALPIVNRMKDQLIQTQVDVLRTGIEAIARKSRNGKSRVLANGRNG